MRSTNIDSINVQTDFPVVFEYLNQDRFKPKIEIREDQGNHWTNLRNCAYLEEMVKDKIVWLEISDLPKFCFDSRSFFVEATAFFMTGSHLHYLLCVLNSKISEWYLDKITSSTGAGTNRWKKVYLEKIPLPEITGHESRAFEQLTLQLLAYHDNGLPISELEEEMHRLLFDKYNLNHDEQRVLLKGNK